MNSRAALPMALAFSLGLAAAVLPAGPACADPTPRPDDAEVYIIWPQDGRRLPGGKFWLRMGLKNFGVAPAGVERLNTGHHHLLLNTPVPPLDQEVPSDDKHLHFGAGQTEVELLLPPGRHTLQLLLADHDHKPHDPPLISERITIIVPPN